MIFRIIPFWLFRFTSIIILFFWGLLHFSSISALQAQSTTSGLIGTNYWMPNWSYGGKIEEVWSQVGEMQLEIVRIGGHGPNDSFWGLSNYDAMLDSIENIGAEVSLQIGHSWTLAQCNSLLNHVSTTGRSITYFSVGNEPDNSEGWDVFDVQDYIDKFIERSRLIRTYFPNAIIAGACWSDMWSGPYARYWIPFLNQTKDSLDANGKYLLNVYDYHNYNNAYSAANLPTWDISQMEADWLANVKPLLDNANATRPANEQLSWSMTEFNITYGNDLMNVGGTNFVPPANQKTYSFYAGQYFAMVYGFGMEYGSQGMYSWSVHESGGSRSNGDLGLFDNAAAPYLPRSNYYHTQMLAANRKANWTASTSSQADVETVAMSDTSGVTVLVMNTRLNPYNFTLSLNNAAPANTLTVNVSAGINAEITDAIGAETTLAFVFDGVGNLIKKISYSKNDADNQLAPSVTMYDVVHPVPGVVQAEDYSTSYDAVFGAIVTETTTDSAAGRNVGYIDIGDWMDFEVDVAVNGTYTVDFRVAGWENGAGIELRDSADNILASASIPNNGPGAYQVWSSESGNTSFYLTKGIQTLRIYATNGPWNLNWFQIRAVLPEITFTNPLNAASYTEGATVTVDVAAPDSVYENVALYLDGALVRVENLAPWQWGLAPQGDTQLENMASGSYELMVVGTTAWGDTKTSIINITVSAVSFPLEWLDFTATWQAGSPHLSWTTASEVNTDVFDIQRSSDGIMFTQVGQLPANGGTDLINQYQFVDRRLTDNVGLPLFYRIRQIDIDGSYSFSNTIELTTPEGGFARVSMIISTDDGELSIEFQTPSQGSRIEIYTSLNQLVFRENLYVQNGELHVNTALWSPGIYYIQIIGSLETKSTKVKI